jgi:hypothetical protein
MDDHHLTNITKILLFFLIIFLKKTQGPRQSSIFGRKILITPNADREKECRSSNFVVLTF